MLKNSIISVSTLAFLASCGPSLEVAQKQASNDSLLLLCLAVRYATPQETRYIAAIEELKKRDISPEACLTMDIK